MVPRKTNTKKPTKRKASSRAAAKSSPTEVSQDTVSRYSRSSYGTESKRGNEQKAVGGFVAAYSPDQGLSEAAAVGRYSRNNPNYSGGKRKMSRGKKVAIVVLVVIIALLASAGTALALYVNSINSNLQGDRSADELEAIDNALVQTSSFNEPFYMMLLGSDARSDDADMGERTDTNIVARVDPTNNIITLISIPRDTMIYLDGYGVNKFNAAYSYGSTAGAINAASDLLDVDISHYAEVDFAGLVGLVDAVGGVDVYVDTPINDWKAGTAVIDEGLQHLDGEAALTFARSRDYADGDFTRVSNQRKLITAIVEKVLSLPVTELPEVIYWATTCVYTDIQVADIIALAQQMKDIGTLTVYSATLPSSLAAYDGLSYVVIDEDSTAEMMALVDQGLDPNTYDASNVDISDELGVYGGSASVGGSTTQDDSSQYYNNSNYSTNDGSGYYYNGT